MGAKAQQRRHGNDDSYKIKDGGTYLVSDISALAKVVGHFKCNKGFRQSLKHMIFSFRKQKRKVRSARLGANRRADAGGDRDDAEPTAEVVSVGDISSDIPLKRMRTTA